MYDVLHITRTVSKGTFSVDMVHARAWLSSNSGRIFFERRLLCLDDRELALGLLRVSRGCLCRVRCAGVLIGSCLQQCRDNVPTATSRPAAYMSLCTDLGFDLGQNCSLIGITFVCANTIQLILGLSGLNTILAKLILGMSL